jgi:hypothetical protein
LHDPPIFDGMRDVEEFMENISLFLPKKWLILVLDTTHGSHPLGGGKPIEKSFIIGRKFR